MMTIELHEDVNNCLLIKMVEFEMKIRDSNELFYILCFKLKHINFWYISCVFAILLISLFTAATLTFILSDI